MHALHFGDYRSIGVAARLRLLAFLCDTAMVTPAARRFVENRTERVQSAELDWAPPVSGWSRAASPLNELPRPEPLGRDRGHSIYWRAGPSTVLKQVAAVPEVENDATEFPGGLRATAPLR